MTPAQRRDLALAALAGVPVADLAQQHKSAASSSISNSTRAHAALDLAFAPQTAAAEPVLFYLPVTLSWIRQFVLALVLICHSPLRGVVELLADLFDYHLSLGSVFNIVKDAVAPARDINARQYLNDIHIGVHDEIFQGKQPVLVGVDAYSTYCYLLSTEEHRDGDTWGVRLLELVAQGFQPAATIADGGTGMRAGQKQALPGVPCRGDIFHGLYEISPLVRYLEKRAYDIMESIEKLTRKQQKHQGRRDARDARDARGTRTGRWRRSCVMPKRQNSKPSVWRMR